MKNIFSIAFLIIIIFVIQGCGTSQTNLNEQKVELYNNNKQKVSKIQENSIEKTNFSNEIKSQEWEISKETNTYNTNINCFIYKKNILSLDGNKKIDLTINSSANTVVFDSEKPLNIKDKYFDIKVILDGNIQEVSIDNLAKAGMFFKVNSNEEASHLINNFKTKKIALIEFIENSGQKLQFKINLDDFNKAYNDSKQLCKVNENIKLEKKFTHPQWEVKLINDKTSNKKICRIDSKFISSNNPMKFPYENTKSSMSFLIDSMGTIYGSLNFSSTPNLLDEKLVDKSYSSEREIIFDDKVEKLLMLHKVGSKEINLGISIFPDFQRFIKNMSKHKNLIIGFDWYGNGIVKFNYKIDGFEDALYEAKYKCGILN
ncbi:hypothetical protein N5U17_11390 [Aliarcobacter butzleri]|uniref:hypothetical protein n=1 Tax=Aliarcobacter butzleri TaxID=28197 RepID=UPI0021B3581B|nr:hypothetical protein [Aliarcobacter butzleri]MCT7604833.1 hypothetical protein [Aliarcobacter butzleri]